MKKLYYFIFIGIVILCTYIINDNLHSSSQGEKLNLIVATTDKKSEDELYKLILDELKAIDSKADVKVKSLKSGISNTFTVDIKTKLTEDEVIDKLSNIKNFKYVQVNYNTKAKSK